MLQSFTVSKCLLVAPSINSCCNVGVVREIINKLHSCLSEALKHAHESCMEKDNTVVFSVILKSEKRVIIFLEFSTVLDATNKFWKEFYLAFSWVSCFSFSILTNFSSSSNESKMVSNSLKWTLTFLNYKSDIYKVFWILYCKPFWIFQFTMKPGIALVTIDWAMNE